MAEENQTGLIGILGGIGRAAGKLLGRKAEQAERDVPSFDSGGLQIVVIGKDGEIMGTLDKSGVGEMKSKSGVGSLLGGVGKGLGKVMGDESEEPFKFDKDYSGMTDEQKNAFIARVNVAKGGMPTGVMTTNKAGVMERDYRDKGGFVPVGIKEKADDVPAMLSKNEFVFTADAVRGAGNGSIEKGAQRMYDTMKKLEKRVV